MIPTTITLILSIWSFTNSFMWDPGYFTSEDMKKFASSSPQNSPHNVSIELSKQNCEWGSRSSGKRSMNSKNTISDIQINMKNAGIILP